jgi:hypothetical protein
MSDFRRKRAARTQFVYDQTENCELVSILEIYHRIQALEIVEGFKL